MKSLSHPAKGQDYNAAPSNDDGQHKKEEEGKYLGSVPHEPRLDHPVEGGLEDPEELLLGSYHLIVGKNDVIMIVKHSHCSDKNHCC